MLDSFVSELGKQLPDCRWRPRSTDSRSLIIPAKSDAFGDIEVIDEGYELTIYFGKFTHSHFDNVEAAVACLGDVFADRLEFYGSRKGSGGFVSFPVKQTHQK
jgi:hypothetical protein